MNRWLYRAAGTVGIAGGFLALGAGSAQADQTEDPGAALADVFTPASGLVPVDLAGADRVVRDTSGLRLDPADGRTAPATGAPEQLSGLPAGVLDALMVRLPIGGQGPDAGIGAGLPLGELIRLDGDVVGLPTDAATGPLSTAVAGAAPAAERTPEIVGPLPFLTGPVTDSLLGGGSLGELVMVGDLAGQVPVAGPMVSQTVGTLPLVGDVVPSTHRFGVPGARTLPADPSVPSLPLPPSSDQLPPVIADQLASEGRFSPELLGTAGPGAAEFTDAVPLIGPALEPISHLIGVGNLASQLPVVGPLAGSALGNLPVVADPVPPAGPPAIDPAGAGGERPVAGDDPEYAESAELLPAGPASGLTQQLPVPLPLEALPLDALPLDTLPLDTLRTLPVVGMLAGGLPL